MSALIGLPFLLLSLPSSLMIADALHLFGVAIFGGLGQLFLIQGYATGNIATSSPFGVISILFAAMIDWVFFDIQLKFLDSIGMALLLIGFYLLHRYKRQKNSDMMI